MLLFIILIVLIEINLVLSAINKCLAIYCYFESKRIVKHGLVSEDDVRRSFDENIWVCW